MVRKYEIQVFFCVVISSSLMSVLVLNADVFVRARRKPHHRLLGYSVGSLYVNGGDDIPVAKDINRPRAKKEFTNNSSYFSHDVNTVVNHENSSVLFNENRVLYKFYRATQDPKYNCVIRIIKHHRPVDEEVYMNNEEWIRSKCEGMPCTIEVRYSLDLKDFWDSDIVILMERSFGYFEWKYLLRARPPGQMWVVYAKECPLYEPQLTPPSTLFSGNPYNLSMTYRLESDISVPYGHFVRDRARGAKHGNKSELMMWMASRCNPLGWDRTKFVHALQKHLDVHVYGRFGTFQCPKRDEGTCHEKMRKYKFYLALENSECAEYITEKMWSNAFVNGMVPVVYGARKKDYVKVAPPHSFIHLSDFKTMEEFVDYINLLDRNETLYNQYFEWRRLGRTYMGQGIKGTMSALNLCKVSKKLVEIGQDPQNSWRGKNPDFRQWWTDSCAHRTELLGVRI